jgi:hypothetical protein
MLTRSQILFWCCCIPIRIAIAFGMLYIPINYLPFVGGLLLSISLGFLVLFFGNLRQTAPEADGITWWANQRLIHGGLYLISSIYAFRKSRDVWIPLMMDALLGAFLGLRRHYVINRST